MRILASLALAFLLQDKPDPAVEQLIEQLKDDSKRASAYFELSRRAGDKEATSEEAFRERRRRPELVICSQGDGKPPIYVLLSDFLPRDKGEKDFPGGDDKLFKPSAPGARKKKKLIEAFTASGAPVKPWGGNNVISDGLLADLNGDGLVERADGSGYSVPKSSKSAAILEVSIVREKAEGIFAVVYNLGTWNEWGYDFVDEDGDGRPEILLGPKTLEGDVVPQVRYTWDGAKKTYVGPQGGEGDHFKVIDPKNIWKELGRLGEENTVFPAVKDRASLKKDRVAGGVAAPPEAAYSYVSLKGRSDEQLFAFMDRTYADPRRGERILMAEPKGFRALDPKAAALALVEANRSAKHRSQVQLAVDDGDGKGPGDAGVLRFTEESSRCYVAHDVHFLLRCDPRSSFLIVASTQEAGVVGKDRGEKARSQDLRFCPLEFEEARHYFQTAAWLERLRSRREGPDEHGMSSSTGDGKGLLSLKFAGLQTAAPLGVEGTLWIDPIPQRWNGLYTKEVWLNFVEFLLGRLAARHLGNRPGPDFYLADRRGEVQPLPKKLLEEQDRACARILEWHLENPEDVAPAMVRAACDAAGTMGLPSAPPLLEKLKARGKDGDAPEEALRKIGVARDEPALVKMALERGAKADWALVQIRTRFPEAYPKVLETQLKVLNAREGARVLAELARVDAARAVSFAATIHPSDRSLLGQAAFVVLRDAGPMAQEAERVKAQLETVVDVDGRWEERTAAIDALVPRDKPGRFPGAEIDAAMQQILGTPPAGESSDFTSVHAATALQRRRGAQDFDLVFGRLKSADTFIVQELLQVVASMAPEATPEQQGKLTDWFKAQMKETNLMMSEICLDLWVADLRAPKQDLEGIATANPEAEESERADTAGGAAQPVRGKFHRARQMAQLWNEEDPVVRAKLLIALALHNGYLFGHDGRPGARRRFEQALSEAAKEMSGERRGEVVAFASTFALKSSASEAPGLATRVGELLK